MVRSTPLGFHWWLECGRICADDTRPDPDKLLSSDRGEP
jgi:hypothetical protein